MIRTLLNILLPPLIIGASVALLFVLMAMRKEPERQEIVEVVPLVRVVEPARRDVAMTVRVHGTVLPRTQITLVPQVAGRVLEVAPSWEEGGFFDPGEILVKIDPADYELALAQAEAAIAQAKVRVAREGAEAELARKEWEAFGKGKPDPLVLRIPQLAEAKAAQAFAESAVEMAKLNLKRTEIRAPFAGRVRLKQVDVGQYVTPGTPLARVYAVDYAEVRLPVPLENLEFLDLPLEFSKASRIEGPEVVLRSRLGAKVHSWKGRIVRTEAEIDPRTRMIHAVARVDDPYDRAGSKDGPPLLVGLFVEAEIRGRTAKGIHVVPREAIRAGSQVWIVDSEDRLRFRDVEVLRFEGERALLRTGVEDGERICISTMAEAVDGRRVKVHREPEK